jgi:hypothetical protein
MQVLFKPIAAVFTLITASALLSMTNPGKRPVHKTIVPEPKIQIAILLDVSNSMDGLIGQAKAQLWNMVGTLGKAQCSNNVNPKIELALYEYGRSTNDVKQGYVKQINGFTGDLDQVSKNLFGLTTNGGDEFCGHVMLTSLDDLKWDNAASSYKVIFIAGNEDFLQGDVPYTKACTEAKNKGVIVNTIYCGPKAQGISEHWNLGAECGNGSFTNIDQDAKAIEIPTPYDSIIFALNEKLNGTYISYGYGGKESKAKQAEVDKLNATMSPSAGLQRIVVKGNNKVYNNASWDLVDAAVADEKVIAKLDMNTLPEPLQKKSREEIKMIVDGKSKERAKIQNDIALNNTKREAFINAEKQKNAAQHNKATLETEVDKIIRAQAKRYNMNIQ